jgi:hypothetical protein
MTNTSDNLVQASKPGRYVRQGWGWIEFLEINPENQEWTWRMTISGRPLELEYDAPRPLVDPAVPWEIDESKS